jgi:predicted component of type VI protein secretion system
MPAQLVAKSDGPNILLDKPILLLGRHAECDIQLNSRKISRRHCCIAQIDNYLIVRDLGSTNGIRINGVRVLEGRLKAGDELTIGNFRYQISWDDRPVPTPASVPKVGHGVRAKASPAAKKPAVISNLPSSEQDDALESCDEPVALGPKPIRAETAAKPATPTPESVGDESSSIFPDNVNLRDSNSPPGAV